MALAKGATDFKVTRENNFPVVLLYLNLHALTVFTPLLVKGAWISTYIFGKQILTRNVYNLIIEFLGFVLIWLGVLGATAGAHRLWAHKSYVADVKLRIFLMICFCISGHGTIYNWILEHRLHHKYFGTKVDPFNNSKSIFHLQTFARVTRPVKGYDILKETIDMSDIENDAVVMFQKK